MDADGLAVGDACYRDPVEAAAAACSSVRGVVSGGYLTCDGVDAVSGSTIYYIQRVQADGSVASYSHYNAMTLQPCVPQDLTTYGPHIAAWFAALVSVLMVRSVWMWVFRRE